jgi:hypothetical protein
MQAAAETQDTLPRPLLIPPRGLGTTDHLVPFQDSTRARVERPLSKLPTAVHAVAEIHDTPPRVLLFADGLRLGTTDQLVPFHDSTKVLDLPLTLWMPTVVHLAAETHDTSNRKLRVTLGLGLGTTDQLVPFQDSIRVP